MPSGAETGPDVVQGVIVAGMPARKELVLAGRAALAERGFDPDDFVDSRAEEQLRRAMPENTHDALAWAWGFLVRYCGSTGRRHEPEPGLPAPTVGTIRQMIADAYFMTKADGTGRGRYGKPYAPATIELVVYCLSMIFDRLQWVNPCRHPLVADQLKGYRSDYTIRDRHKTDEADALTNEQSVLLARTQDLGTVQGLRNAALLRGQFDLGCRADEWCQVWGQDVVWLDSRRVVVEFVRTKGGKRRKVPMQALPKIDGDVDPVLLLSAYMKARMSAGWDGTGPLWVEVHRGDRRKDFETSLILGGRFTLEPMKYGAYAAVFNRAVAKTGIDLDPITKRKNRHYTTHSNRIGMIDEASRNGMRLEDIAPRSGHSPASPVIHKYLRQRPQWGDDNPGVLIRRSGHTEEEASDV